MDFYYYGASIYSQKALMAIWEKGGDPSFQHVSLLEKEQVDEYKKLYPMGKLPGLNTGEGFIPESTSIVEYLDEVFPETPLILGEDARLVRHWDRMLDMYLLSPSVSSFFESMKPEPDLERLGKYKFQVECLYEMLEGQLEGREYLVGNRFTLADISLLLGLRAGSNLCSYEKYPRISTFFDKHSERESYQRVMEIFLPEVEKLKAAFSA